jgi:hypothetical protein
MEKSLNIESKIIDFKLNEGADCWQTKTNIDSLEIEIEIDFKFHIEKEVDWKHFKLFFEFLNNEGRLKKLIQDSQNLATELGKAFFRDSYDEVSDFKMVFNNSIFYKGKTDGNFTQNGYSYSLIFNYFTKRESGIFADNYGIYSVDIENNIIVGAKRHQC